MPRKRRKNKQDQSMSIFFILDGSGSMEPVQDDVINGVNGFIKDQQKDADNTVFSLTVFDTKVKQPYDATPVADVKSVNRSVTFMGGMTALYDAIGKTLNDAESKNLPGKKLVVIYTDGAENSSREFNKSTVRSLIERLEKQNDWTFVFMSADLDQAAEAQAIGIPLGNYVTSDSARTGATLMAVSQSASAYKNVSDVTATRTFAEDFGLDKVSKDMKPKRRLDPVGANGSSRNS